MCGGLTAEQLATRPVPPSSLSLLGLVRHLAKVERVWLRRRSRGHDVPPLYGGQGADADFEAVDAGRAEQELDQLRTERRLTDDAVAAVPFTHEIDVCGGVMSLRTVYVHLIGEYARHDGHADLQRQALDGVTGR